jgi:GNAT superfamily N-acetyltransferase
MEFAVRNATLADATEIAAVWAAALPYRVVTPTSLAHDLAVAGGPRALVGVEGERVVGFGRVSRPGEGGSRLTVLVAPDERGHGVGSALVEALMTEAVGTGARLLLTVVDDASRKFAVRRGFVLGRELSYSRADLATIPEPQAVPAGFSMKTFAEADPHAIWEAFGATADDDPSGLAVGIGSYDEWVRTRWSEPLLSHKLSIAVLQDDRVVAFTALDVDFDRKVVWSNATGTRPEYRGWGLATLAKSAALHRCREAGITAAYTGNDAANEPMLAVNRRLDYRRIATSWTAAKDL